LHLAFIACEDNDRLLMLNLLTRQVVQSFDVGGEADVLAFDPGPGMLYVAGEGSIGPDAHVVGVPSTHRAYFPLKNLGGRPVLRVMAPR
jgi:hypothetical protein